jgi:hypothetical protein
MKVNRSIYLLMLSLFSGYSAGAATSSSTFRTSDLANLTNHSPTSGVISGPDRTLWFDGIHKRTENRRQGELVEIYVTASNRWWGAYPACGRVADGVARYPSPPFPEETRRLALWVQGANSTNLGEEVNSTNLGEEVFRGFPCWKYEQVSVRRTDTGEFLDAFTNRWLVLANPEFPLLMRQGRATGWITNNDVLSIQLDVPIPPDLFICPTNLKLTRQFRIPPVPFEIVLRQSRGSARWGWSEVTTNVVSSDGVSVSNYCFAIYRDTKGEQQHGPTIRSSSFQQGILDFNYPMTPPYWPSVRKVGEDTVLGMKADVLDSATLGERYWVVDHPVLGAFSAKWSNAGETNEVLRLEVRE